MRVIVCQPGSRQRYAIPRMLEEAGMLEALYTDSTAHSPLGKISRVLSPFISNYSSSARRLANRVVRGVPTAKIFTTDVPLLSDLIHRVFDNETSFQKSLRQHNVLSKCMIKWGLGNADVIYSMYHANQAFIEYAKLNGKKVVVDVYINPLNLRLIDDETNIFSKWGHAVSAGLCEDYEAYFREMTKFADSLLCPSNWAADGVRQLCPEHAHKIRICPYGSSIDYGGKINTPVKGRIFWAGGAAIRKGLHYMAMAANELIPKYPELEFRMAGFTDRRIINFPECKNLKFLGVLTKQQMQNEFLTADMFVFPTLSEGLAGVVLEAIAAGCPVITTCCAGIDEIENGINGTIIPARNLESLVQAIQRMYLDRDFRNKTSVNTIRLADNYTEKAWAERLKRLINSM